jgi:hypothetical protein
LIQTARFLDSIVGLPPGPGHEGVAVAEPVTPCGGVEIYRAFILRDFAPQVTPRSLFEVPRWSRIEGSELFKPALDFMLDASLWAILLIIAAIFYAIAIARFSKAS